MPYGNCIYASLRGPQTIQEIWAERERYRQREGVGVFASETRSLIQQRRRAVTAAQDFENVDEDPQKASYERRREGGRTENIDWHKLGLEREESNDPESDVGDEASPIRFPDLFQLFQKMIKVICSLESNALLKSYQFRSAHSKEDQGLSMSLLELGMGLAFQSLPKSTCKIFLDTPLEKGTMSLSKTLKRKCCLS